MSPTETTKAPATKSSNVLAEERTELAVFRTALAASRSLMAWVRTGLSMNGFGYTIYKFIQNFSEAPPHAARRLGLILIGLGTLSIVFGAIEYWQTSREIRSTFGMPMRKFPLALAGSLGGLGVILFLSVVLRIS